jgi:hypothetical protein
MPGNVRRGGLEPGTARSSRRLTVADVELLELPHGMLAGDAGTIGRTVERPVGKMANWLSVDRMDIDLDNIDPDKDRRKSISREASSW